MKRILLALLLPLLVLFTLNLTILAEDNLKINCKFFAPTQLEAEIGAVSMAQSLSKNLKQISLDSKEFKTETGESYWIANFIVEITTKELLEAKEKAEKAESDERPKY